MNPGFNAQHVLTAEISLPALRYPDKTAQANFFAELDRRVTPSRRHARWPNDYSPDERSEQRFLFHIEGRPVDDAHPGPDEEIRLISPDFFRTLEMPSLKGRFFTRRTSSTRRPS